MDMTDEIAAINEHQKITFELVEDPEIPDNGMYTERDNIMEKSPGMYELRICTKMKLRFSASKILVLMVKIMDF